MKLDELPRHLSPLATSLSAPQPMPEDYLKSCWLRRAANDVWAIVLTAVRVGTAMTKRRAVRHLPRHLT